MELDKHEPMLAEIERTPLKERMADDETLSQSLDNHIEGLKAAFEQLRFMILGRCKILKDNKNLAHLFTERMLNLFAFLAENKLKMSRWLDENGNISLIDARPVCIRKVLQACKVFEEALLFQKYVGKSSGCFAPAAVKPQFVFFVYYCQCFMLCEVYD